MQRRTTLLLTVRKGRATLGAFVLALLCAFVALCGTASAQMSGSYTIGGSGANYSTIESAISALQSAGVNGAVTFRIASGTYNAPAAGYRLQSVTGMSASNTVTFKPASGATVVISGTSNQGTGIFTFNGGKNFIIDGSNATSGTTRDMTIRQLEAYYDPAILMLNDADKNVVKNCILQANSQYASPSLYNYDGNTGTYIYGSGVVMIGQTNTSSANDSNTIQNNTIGDPAGTNSCNIAVCINGYNVNGNTSYNNNGNKIIGNDIVNFGRGTSYTSYGIVNYYYCAGTLIQGNKIYMTQPSPYYYVYGIYLYDSYTGTGNHVVDGNKIYKLSGAPIYGYEYIYGIYNYNSNASQTTTFSNNMISMTEGGQTYQYAMYIGGSGTYNSYYNSFYSGGVAVGGYPTYMLYKSGSFTLNHRNNIYYSTRTGGTAGNYGLYISSTSGWSSDYNIINLNTGSNYYTGYYSGVQTLLSGFQTASGQDAHSMGGNPQFIDPDNGNLHISTTRRTPVESRGTPISGLTTDADGDTRNSTTPDIGADEGTFTSVLTDDMSSDRFVNPLNASTVRSNTYFTPSGFVYNIGTNARTSVPVRFRIWSGTTVVYNDLQTISSLGGLISQQVNFNQVGNVSGSTLLATGTYTIEMRTEYTGDLDTSNNAIYGTITVKNAMSGTYTINKNGSGTRNYTSFTAAMMDLNALGVSTVASDSAVIFRISSGTYDGTTETFPITLNAAPGMTSTKNVTFKPAASASVILTGGSSNPILDINQGDYFVLDGSNSSGGTTRNWKITNTSTGPSVRFVNGATYNTLKNLQLISGNTSTNYSSSGNNGNVTFSNSTSTYGVGNSYNALLNNQIGDTTGTIRAGIQVFSYGDYTYMNTANTIQGNEVVNFGGPSSSYGYGIVESYYSNQTKIFGNQIHNSNTVGTSSTYAMYGIYYYFTYGNGDSIGYNKVYDLTSAYTYVNMYGIYLYYPNTSSTTVIHNNMFNMSVNSGYIYPIYMYGYNTADVRVEHNTINIGGAPSSAYGIYNSYGYINLYFRNNILTDSRTSNGSSDYLLYVYGMYGTLTSNYNAYYLANGGYIGYNSNGTYNTLSSWQSASGQDANSIYGSVPYVSASTGDLHINTQPIFKGEGIGTPLGYQYDYDMQQRDLNTPDVGADEGDFNGGGITLTYPNGGEQLTVNYLLTVQYRTNRAMGVRIELSTNNGNTWAQVGSVSPTTNGANTFTFTTPDTVTNQARLRVISMKNQWEADTSDQVFSLVRPIVTIIAPNGGERLVGSDTTQIQWSSQFIPPTTKVQIDYSTDGGGTWLPVAASLTSNNLPATNSYSWIIPSNQSTTALMRVKLVGASINDMSDTYFTMLPTPNVKLNSPNGGEQWFVNEKNNITWTSLSTDYVRLDYSVDGGTSWINIVDRVPSYLGTYAWTVPPTVTTKAFVRATNVERPRFVDASDNAFSILKATVTVTAPNGGEKFELSQPVTVTWNSANSTHLRLDYSGDNGSTWTKVAGGLSAALGAYQFTPPAIPTKTALVRLTDEDRTGTMDVSDAQFELMAPKSIMVYTPATGDELPRGGVTQITWTAPRVDAINVLYSSNGGSSWVTVTSNVPASQGSYNWNIPTVNTTQGKIRLTEVGGTTIGESGIFSIADPKVPFIQVTSPNGGEKYSVGENLTITWTDANITDRLAVSYSVDGGSTWQVIQSNIMPIVTQLDWKAPDVPSDKYRIKVSSNAANDESDANFTVTRQLVPKITLVSPNGGESLRVDSTFTIAWTEKDITGAGNIVDLSYSVNGGASWKPIASVPAGVLQYSWQVPSDTSSNAMVRVSVASQATDQSDASFVIMPKLLAPITVLKPNGGETVESNAPYMITFSAPADIANVKIELSRDGGQSWEGVIASTPATSGSYNWIVPVLSKTISTALIRVSDALDANRFDVSDAPFTIHVSTSGVGMDAGVTGVRGLALIGNFPNPFASSTEIRWTQPVSGDVSLRLFQENGAIVRDLFLGHREAGQQFFGLQAGELASGLYHYELRVGSDVARGAMLIAR